MPTRAFLLFALALIALSPFTSTLPLGHRFPSPTVEPIRWRTPFGKHLIADSSVELEWQGGSGQGYVSDLLPIAMSHYMRSRQLKDGQDVYYIPQWPGSTDIKVSFVPLRNHTRTERQVLIAFLADRYCPDNKYEREVARTPIGCLS